MGDWPGILNIRSAFIFSKPANRAFLKVSIDSFGECSLSRNFKILGSKLWKPIDNLLIPIDLYAFNLSNGASPGFVSNVISLIDDKLKV